METRVNAGLSAKIDRIVARRTEPVPGLAIAVIKNGKIVHLAGYGSADLETATPITPQTQFHMASCGKQFTALGIMLLKDSGKLAFDDHIGKHIPELAGYPAGVTIRHRDELDQVLLTMGLVFMSVAGATYVWGPLQQPLQPPAWLSGAVDVGFRSFPAYRSFLILCGAALVTALWLGIERTRFGARVRASVDNLRMAQSVGIDTSRLFMTTFALGSGLAGLGGGLGADLLAINPSYALQNLAYFLIVVAVGGLGSIRGPFVAALLLGVADSGFKYLLPEFGAFFIYTLTMAVLLWRPRGLFGRP